MNIPNYGWLLIVALLAVFLFHHARAGIAGKANPHALADYVAVAVLALVVIALFNYHAHPSTAGGATPLENLDLCTPSKVTMPRAPQPTANLSGCKNYVAPVIDPAHDIPVKPLDGQLPDGSMPTPSWAAKP